MALVSLKTKPSYPTAVSDEYGYGTSINLTDDQCEALGIKTSPPAGTVYAVNAVAVAQSVTERAEADGDVKVCMCLQLTAMELTPKSGRSRASVAKSLYPDMAE